MAGNPQQLGIVQYANVSKEVQLNVENWICIYPAYIDKDRTLKEGRRLSKENCTKLPDAYAIYYVCAALLKLQVALESKRYSKSWWDYVGRGVGRVKVNILNDKGEKQIKDPTSPDIIFDSRKTLFKRIAALLNDPDTKIPKNFRPKEQEAEKIALAEEEKLEKASGGSGNRKKKKKNKKNKRR
eukprot:g8412.t1